MAHTITHWLMLRGIGLAGTGARLLITLALRNAAVIVMACTARA